MSKGSEQISARWLRGLERVCRDCGSRMPNLARDVGEIRRNADGTGWVRCMECLTNRTRRAA